MLKYVLFYAPIFGWIDEQFFSLDNDSLFNVAEFFSLWQILQNLSGNVFEVFGIFCEVFLEYTIFFLNIEALCGIKSLTQKCWEISNKNTIQLSLN
jgi:hypothetical protein